MMTEHVRGPIRCCETTAKDVFLIEHAEALLHHPEFLGVTINERCRGKEDNFGGEDEICICTLVCLETIGIFPT